MVVTTPGDRNIDLTLIPRGKVHGKALVDKPRYLEKGMVKFVLQPGSTWHDGRTAYGKCDPEGRITWKPLPPDIYEFQVILPGMEQEPYLRIPGIQVEAGNTTAPAAIQAVDLRGRFEEVRLYPKNQ